MPSKGLRLHAPWAVEGPPQRLVVLLSPTHQPTAHPITKCGGAQSFCIVSLISAAAALFEQTLCNDDDDDDDDDDDEAQSICQEP
ncbi:hypothetical protein [Flavobacterium sp.]|uniref:hypothetical protein n=1 Tax=Flavobacterium sp. TaxID=239 RepID=UPI0040344E8D